VDGGAHCFTDRPRRLSLPSGQPPKSVFLSKEEVMGSKIENTALEEAFFRGPVLERNARFLMIDQTVDGPPERRFQRDKIREFQSLEVPLGHEFFNISARGLLIQPKFPQETLITVQNVLFLIQEQNDDPADLIQVVLKNLREFGAEPIRILVEHRSSGNNDS
jgi:hypothetical protein